MTDRPAPADSDTSGSGREGPVSRLIEDRPPFGPMQRLDHDELAAAQRATMASPRRRAGLSACGRCSS